MSPLTKIAEANNGTLYESNSFLIPVVTGSYYEMGLQYGALMVKPMETAYDTIVAPGVKSGKTTPQDRHLSRSGSRRGRRVLLHQRLHRLLTKNQKN
jgi:hypothetical protein